MASAFIIRPFGTKKGIDFDRVERELIDPALTEFEFAGRTTGDSLKQGNIRTEMFQRLLTADLVVVDISIGNPNVFYELGIRHALRNKRTFMIRSSSNELPPDDVPFDLRTDRYLAYDPANPGAACEELKKGLRQTLLSDEKDSPVFQLLPDLGEQDRASFLAVPKDFQEEVERAKAQAEPRHQWGDLKLLQTEVRGFQWEVEGLRVVGRAQFRKKAYEAACHTWELVRKADPDDKEANLWLGTIYQRLGNSGESDIALQRVLANKATTPLERAEVHALIGRNLKDKWTAEWSSQPPDQRRAAALRSPFLQQSYEMYRKGFLEALDHYYPGVNAMGLLLTLIELAKALPDVWDEGFKNAKEAAGQLESFQEELVNLRGSVTLSVEAAEARMQRAGKSDMWLLITVADVASLTSDRPAFVANQYRKAVAGAQDFEIDAVRRQLALYEQLEVMTANVAAALKALPATQEPAEPPHVLLFTGHRVDSPGRKKPRFPNTKEAEAAARLAIQEEIKKAQAAAGGQVIGIAGGASGGDILFHEICAEMSIPTVLYLVMPRDEYVKQSVQDAGRDWVTRFDKLYAKLPRRELERSAELPRWLQNKPDYNIWQRNNLWTLYNAMARGSQYVTLIALWDGGTGDGPGGTEDMVNRANASGAAPVILPTKKIFGLE